MRKENESRKRHMGWKTKVAIIVVVLLAFAIGSCDFVASVLEETSDTKEFTFSSNASTGRNVLAVTNLTAYNANLTFGWADNRSAVQTTAPTRPRLPKNWKSDALRMDLEEASLYNANPPPVPQGSPRSVDGQRFSTSYSEGTTKSFYVETAVKNRFTQITAKLQKQGAYCNVWVDENFSGTGTGQISPGAAQALADKFDQIYPFETKLLGYERGGGVSETAPDYGGADGDPRIQILVHDIAGENVIGYFWGKDDGPLGTNGSNQAEIFYVDVVQLSQNQDLVYSTLIHEFQHMINFNQKYLRNSSYASDTWFDEMLAMVAEDVIGPLVGITKSSGVHPINYRIPLFLSSYSDVGVTQWLSGNDAILSYSIVYAFGAYLVRNYGGPKLLAEMLRNNYGNQNSITQALRTVNSSLTLSFEVAMDSYAEALLYSKSKSTGVGGITGKKSFDRTEEHTISGPGYTYTYTAEAFDIWTMQMDEVSLEYYAENLDYVDEHYKGPIIFPLLAKYPLPGYSVCLHGLSTDTYGYDDSVNGQTLLVEFRPGYAVIDMKELSY